MGEEKLKRTTAEIFLFQKRRNVIFSAQADLLHSSFQPSTLGKDCFVGLLLYMKLFFLLERLSPQPLISDFTDLIKLKENVNVEKSR